MNTPIQNRSAKVIWFLWGNPVFTASSRIHGLAVHQELVKLGFNSHIVYLPEFIEEEIPFDFSRRKYFETFVSAGDKIVLQKIKSPVNLPLLRYFKELGLKLILIDCDWPLTKEVGEAVDLVICTSKMLRNKYLSLNLNATYIEDCPEIYFEQARKAKKGKLECVWFGDGSGGRWKDVEWLEQLFRDPRLSHWSLKTISNHTQATIRWSPDYWHTLKQADACAIPIHTIDDASSAKSANRLLQAMALSVPTICSPLPSYFDVVTHGKEALICHQNEEWIAAFQKFEDETFRIHIGEEGYKKAKNFSIDQTIHLWIKALSLDEGFKRGTQTSATQNRLSDFFYRKLVMKNPYYAKKMSLSGKNLFLLMRSVALKVTNRIKRLIS